MYLGGALRRTPFFAIRRPGRNAYFYRLAGIVFGVVGGERVGGNRFFCWWAGESSRGTAKTPPLQSGNAAILNRDAARHVATNAPNRAVALWSSHNCKGILWGGVHAGLLLGGAL